APWSNRCSAASANRREIASWSAASTFTTNRVAAWSAPCISLRLSIETSSSGGSSETEAMELAVIPTRAPSARRAVTTVTPVAKRPRSWRNRAGSTPEEGGVTRAIAAACGERTGGAPARSCRSPRRPDLRAGAGEAGERLEGRQEPIAPRGAGAGPRRPLRDDEGNGRDAPAHGPEADIARPLVADVHLPQVAHVGHARDVRRKGDAPRPASAPAAEPPRDHGAQPVGSHDDPRSHRLTHPPSPIPNHHATHAAGFVQQVFDDRAFPDRRARALRRRSQNKIEI